VGSTRSSRRRAARKRRAEKLAKVTQYPGVSSETSEEPWSDERFAENPPPVEAPATEPVSGYAIGEVVGHGLVGAVRRGRYRPTGREVAIEEVPDGLRSDRSFAKRLVQGAEQASALRGPAIVAVYDLLDDAGKLEVVGELASGTPLGAIPAQERDLPISGVLTLLDDVLAALSEAHGKGVAHGGVADTTVLLAPNGTARLAGFGIAAALAGGGPPDAPKDVVAAAGLGLELLGRSTSVADDQATKRLLAILKRAADPAPDKRFSSADEFRTALQQTANEALGSAWHHPEPLAALVATHRQPAAAGTAPPPASTTHPAGGGRSRLASAVIAAAVVLVPIAAGAVIALVVTGAFRPGDSGSLVVQPGVTLSVTPSHGGCDTTFAFTADGGVKGQGNLVYRWDLSDGRTSGDQTRSISSTDARFRFIEHWPFQGPRTTQEVMTFRLISPSQLTLRQLVTYSCP
jgi:protein kinase-like protein